MMINTPKKIKIEIAVRVKMINGLRFILALALKDSDTPTVTAQRNWIHINIPI
jgi:acyl-CoA thioesterase FadM